MSHSASARPAPGNRWDLLAERAPTSWNPTRTVSVCVPARGSCPTIVRLIDAVQRQSYPAELVEIVVADDGITPAVRSQIESTGAAVINVPPPRLSFGAGRARNTAAKASTGDVLVFLDADVIPTQRFLETCLRWFELVDDALVTGPLRFLTEVEADQLTRTKWHDDLRSLAVSGTENQPWRRAFIVGSAGLRTDPVDTYRAVVGANLAVSRKLYDEVGGFRELGIRGIEDVEFGYRFHNAGAFLVPDPAAIAWHVGPRTMTGRVGNKISDDRADLANRLLPIGRFRRPEALAGLSGSVAPRLAIQVRNGSSSGRPHSVPPDVTIRDSPEQRPSLSDVASGTFAVASVPGDVCIDASFVEATMSLLLHSNCGVLRSFPGGEIEVVRVRALRAAARYLGESRLDDLIDAAGHDFGVWLAPRSAFGAAAGWTDE